MYVHDDNIKSINKSKNTLSIQNDTYDAIRDIKKKIVQKLQKLFDGKRKRRLMHKLDKLLKKLLKNIINQIVFPEDQIKIFECLRHIILCFGF